MSFILGHNSKHTRTLTTVPNNLLATQRPAQMSFSPIILKSMAASPTSSGTWSRRSLLLLCCSRQNQMFFKLCLCKLHDISWGSNWKWYSCHDCDNSLNVEYFCSVPFSKHNVKREWECPFKGAGCYSIIGEQRNIVELSQWKISCLSQQPEILAFQVWLCILLTCGFPMQHNDKYKHKVPYQYPVHKKISVRYSFQFCGGYCNRNWWRGFSCISG